MKLGGSPQQRIDPFGPEWENETELEMNVRQLRREMHGLIQDRWKERNHWNERFVRAHSTSGRRTGMSDRDYSRIQKQFKDAGINDRVRQLREEIEELEKGRESLERKWDDIRRSHGLPGRK